MRYLLIALALLFGAGCKKDKDGGGGAPLPSVLYIGGVWHGTFASTVDPIKPMVLNLAQNGFTITGTFNIDNGTILGTVNGSVSGMEFDFTASQSTPCAGTYTGGADVSGSSMSGGFGGTSSCLGALSGVFNVSK